MNPLRHSLAALGAMALTPAALGALALSPKLRPGWRERLGERPTSAKPGSVWLHAASVGEITAALPLADRLAARGHPVVASTLTASGRDVVRRRRPELAACLAPLDHPWSVARALDRVQPAMVVLVETELWPTWIRLASERRIPVVVVSARITERSFQTYRRVGPLFSPTLRRLAAVGARGPAAAERFEALGVPPERIRVTGDLKLDPPAREPLAGDLARALGDQPVLVAGSTHAGEEEIVLEAQSLAELQGDRCLAVLAPRHPERFTSVARLVRSKGRRLHHRTRLAGARLAAGDVLLLDTMGDLAALYPRAQLAFVGGSLVPLGGHNVLEPLFSGVPVTFGPHTEKTREAATLAVQVGAGIEIASAQALAGRLSEVLRDPDRARLCGARGRDALADHAGSVERSVALVSETLVQPLPHSA